MDDSMDMDDLFGDKQVVLPLSASPPANGLIQRMEEMHTAGCCARLAWSKMGYIIYMSPDRSGIILRNHVCSPRDGDWRLSKEYPLPDVQKLHEGSLLEHLAWSPSGTDLAVVDAMGRVTILDFHETIVCNQMKATRSCLADQEDDLSAVSGLFWLNPDRQFPLPRPVQQVDGQYQYVGPPTKSLGPFHPQNKQNKSALITVTRGASLRLLYQMLDGKWRETSTELESLMTSDDVITHASFCADKDHTLLLLVRTLASSCRLYRIGIQWTRPVADSADVQRSAKVEQPIILVRPLKFLGRAIEDNALPAADTDLPLGSGSGSGTGTGIGIGIGTGSESRPRPRPRLSSLELISPAHQSKHAEPSYPTLIAIFTHLSLDSQDAFSTIARWELKSEPQKLHASWEGLTSKKKSGSGASDLLLDFHLCDIEIIDKIILGVQSLNVHTVISFAYSDGTIDFRDRASWTTMKRSDETDKVGGLTQVGFAFNKHVPCLHTVTSPNACLAIHLDTGGVATLEMMDYLPPSLPSVSGDARYRALIAALTMPFVYSCTQHNNMDDVLQLIRSLSSPSINSDFLSSIQTAISLSVDYTMVAIPNELFRKYVLQRCLSVQSSLGYGGESRARTLSSKTAWLTLHLRCVSLLFAYTFNAGPKPGADGQPNAVNLTRPEVLHSLTGVIRFSIDLIAYIIDSLLELRKHPRLSSSTPLTKDALQSVLIEQNSPALALLLSSTPRTLLHHNLRALRGLLTSSTKHLTPTTPLARKQAFTAVISLIETGAIVKVTAFERLVSEVDTAIKKAYATRTPATTDADRADAERRLLIEGILPDCFLTPQSVLEGLLGPSITHRTGLPPDNTITSSLDRLKKDVDLGRLYFKDFSWLEVSDDLHTRRWSQSHRVDAMRKTVMTLSRAGAGAGAAAVATPSRDGSSDDDCHDDGDMHRHAEGADGRPPRRWRRCTRCCAYMEENPSSAANSFGNGLLERMCFCGSTWMAL